MILPTGYGTAGPDVEAAPRTRPAVQEGGMADEERRRMVKAHAVLEPGDATRVAVPLRPETGGLLRLALRRAGP